MEFRFIFFGDARQEITEIDKQNINVLLPMEINDFSLSQYVRDSSILNKKKTIISIGHFNIEEPGMKYLIEYLPKAIGENIPSEFVKVGDTYKYIKA